MSTSSATTRRVLVFPSDCTGTGTGNDKDFAIDEGDMRVIREALLGGEIPEDEIPISTRVQRIVDISEHDDERRVCRLSICDVLSLPTSIGQLHNLIELNLKNSRINSLPPSIGRLKNLAVLSLEGSMIKSLPRSIGQLQSLTHLNLRNTKNLLKLPDEIGNLINLKNLDLECSKINSLPRSIERLKNLTVLSLNGSTIASLPPSIGQLQSLTHLYLRNTKNSLQLPKEIGNLTNLKEPNLDCSKIVPLPPSIRRLKNLAVLILRDSKTMSLPPSIGRSKNPEYLYSNSTQSFTQHPEEIELILEESSIKKLPEEIGSLANLRVLALTNSGNSITSMPDSIGRLKYLVDHFFSLKYFPDLQKRDQHKFLLAFVRKCQSLCALHKGTPIFELRDELEYALACSRARVRIGIRSKYKTSLRSTPKLWPLMLNCATRAFGWYGSCYYDYNRPNQPYRIEKPDAIYQLLVDGRESFIGLLLDRNTKDDPAKTKIKSSWFKLLCCRK